MFETMGVICPMKCPLGTHNSGFQLCWILYHHHHHRINVGAVSRLNGDFEVVGFCGPKKHDLGFQVGHFVVGAADVFQRYLL